MRQNNSAHHNVQIFIFVILALLAFYFRIYHATLGWFIHDSARDMRFAQAIASGKTYPLLGPTAGGIFYLGPFYYYLISIPFFFTKNITVPYYFIALLNALSVILTYFFVKKYFNTKLAIVSSLLYATFPFAIITGRNMWNPALLPTFNILFFLSLFLWLDGKRHFLMLFLPLFSILTQVHAIEISFLVILIIAFFINKRGFCIRYFLIGLGLFILPYLPYIYYEFCHRSENLRAFITFLTKNYQSYPIQDLPVLFLNAIFLYPKMAQDFDIPLSLNIILWIENILWLIGLFFYFGKLIIKKINQYEFILLTWFLVPTISILTKKDVIWFYYFDVLYPVQFILIASFIFSLLSYLKNKVFSLFIFVFLVVLIAGSLCSAFYIDLNLKKNGFYQIRLSGFQNIRYLNQGPEFIMPTFKTKLRLWQKITEFYPFSYEQTLTHIHGLGAWLIRDQDNRFIDFYLTQSQKARPTLPPPHLLITLNKSYKGLFSEGMFSVQKIEDLPQCENVPAHFMLPLTKLRYFETPLFSWRKKTVEIRCNCVKRRALKVEIVLSGKNHSAQIEFFSKHKKIKAPQETFYTPYVGVVKSFEIGCLPSLLIKVRDKYPLVFDIDIY